MISSVTWNTKLSFTGHVRGHETQMDTSFANGGLNRGPSPKEMLLNAISACAGMDIVSILHKNEQDLLSLEIEATAQLTNTIPSYFSNIHLVFKMLGAVSDLEATKSCDLSMTKYCGVSYMLLKACPITYEVKLNNNIISNGISHFD